MSRALKGPGCWLPLASVLESPDNPVASSSSLNEEAATLLKQQLGLKASAQATLVPRLTGSSRHLFSSLFSGILVPSLSLITGHSGILLVRVLLSWPSQDTVI